MGRRKKCSTLSDVLLKNFYKAPKCYDFVTLHVINFKKAKLILHINTFDGGVVIEKN